MEKYIETVIDCLKPEPKLSSTLITLGDGQTRASAALNLLSLPSKIFYAQCLATKVGKVLSKGDESALELRSLYSRMIEQMLSLLGLLEKITENAKCEYINYQRHMPGPATNDT